MDSMHIADLEAAINHWRERSPAGSDAALAPELAALAELYARMAIEHREELDAAQVPAAARAAWLHWYAHTPDAPCIAVCSTAQGDAVCKGCGRTEDEVRDWPALSPWAKRAVWRRITREGTALRYTRYVERAQQHGHSFQGRPADKHPMG